MGERQDKEPLIVGLATKISLTYPLKICHVFNTRTCRSSTWLRVMVALAAGGRTSCSGHACFTPNAIYPIVQFLCHSCSHCCMCVSPSFQDNDLRTFHTISWQFNCRHQECVMLPGVFHKGPTTVRLFQLPRKQKQREDEKRKSMKAM